MFSPGAATNYLTGTPFRSPAITSAKRAPPTCRKWRSRWRTALRTSNLRPPPDCGWTNSRRSFPSSLIRTTNFWRKSRSFARRGAYGRASCANASARAMMLRFHAQSAGSSLTAQQPENNLVRTAVQCLAAVLGGCQSLHANALDEALALPTERAALLALRTQQIIAQETGVANTVDPVGGAYAIEKMTDEIEAGAKDYIAKIDAMGGMLRAIETGYVQQEIQKSAYQYQRAIEAGDQIVVGVNRFRADSEQSIPTLRIDPEIERTQVARLNALRARRDSGKALAAIEEVERRARGNENLMPAILAAVEAYATVGEISDAMRRAFGEYHESVVV